MNTLHSLLLLWALAASAMTLGWWWQKRHANAGIVDAIWAGGVGMAAVLMALLGDGVLLARVLLALMGCVWGLRLAIHLWQRVRHEPEDGRYQHLRKYWNGHQGKWFGFFQFQAMLIVLFALPFAVAARSPQAHVWPWLALALAIWLGSVAGETIADRQLARFRADPANRGRTCRSGLWRYSRHPNYFFEWLHWFAYVALAVGSPLWWLSLSGPVLMYAFLRWISGIPFTEAQALRTRGDDYRDYQRSTPMLFPWFPKSTPSPRPHP